MAQKEPDSEVTLYSWTDDSLPDRPVDPDPGETWRSKEVYRCSVCHTKTNKWISAGYYGRGPRIFCPANKSDHDIKEWVTGEVEPEEREKKHDELREYLSRRQELTERLEQYDTTSAAGDRTRERIHDDLKVLDEQIADLRDWFGNRFDDVFEVEDADQPVITGLSPGD